MDDVFDLCAKVIGPNYYEAFDLFSAIQRYDLRSTPEQWRIAKTIDGKIVAHVGVSLRDIRIGEALLSVGGIRDIAVHPDYAKDRPDLILIDQAVKYLKGAKMDIVVAFGDERDYRDAGFVGVLPDYRFSIPAGEAEYLKRNLKFNTFDVKSVKRLNQLYLESYKAVPAHVVRDEGVFLANLKRGRIMENLKAYPVHTFGKDQTISAYIIMHDERIVEACAEDEEGWETLVSFLCDRATAERRENMELNGLSFSHPIIKHCRRYRHRAEKLHRLKNCGMAKILGLRRVLEKLMPELSARMSSSGFKQTQSFQCVNFEVGKEKLSVVFDGSGVRLEMPSAKPDMTIASTEEAFTQMVFGSLAIDEIADVTITGSTFLAPILFPQDNPQIAQLDRF